MQKTGDEQILFKGAGTLAGFQGIAEFRRGIASHPSHFHAQWLEWITRIIYNSGGFLVPVC